MSSPPNREVTLFSAALELPAGERAAYLAESCADDPALRLRLEALLRVHEDAITFLEHQAPGAPESPMGAERPDATVRITAAPSEKPGDRIGRYKLLQQIGEGGCGVVYMAEQEEPVRRRVALKVIKLGMDTKQVIARFEAERQALALMDHPNIAKVLDAGATETGRPYFVMELVRGIKITEYCDANNLSTRERLHLFIQVCQAIQHAHQKGIIHRDIKPSNILVTVNEPGAPGCPKVIDFGIAKATTNQRLTDKTVFTAFEQFIGTPAYMSPEQAMMTTLDIDTRTDIYSLGVLLYELLTGKTPLDQKELLAAGLEEMRRTIREQEPARPSTRLSTMLEADLTTTAKHRHTDAPRLLHLLRGDLDWIVMKALEKERARRYETANGLASDIQRHLNNEPVVARPPSNLYRFQKLARRNKLAFAAGAAVASALVLGMVGSAWEAARAKRAERQQSLLRQNAVASQKKATAISDFLQQLLSSANPDALKGSEYTVRQMLDDFSTGLENQFQDQPEVEAALRTTIGRAYYRLGVADKAQAHHERALALRRRVFGNQAEQVAESLVDYTWTFFEQGPFEPGQYAKGEPYVREALAIYRKRGTTGQPVISALWALQKLVSAQGRTAEVETITEEALAIAAKSPGVEFPEMASMLHGLAEARNAQFRYAEAEALAQKAVGMHKRVRSPDDLETAWALFDLGVALRSQQKLTEAEDALREALRIFRKYYSAGHKSVDLVLGELKLVLEARGDSAGLEALARQRLDDSNQRLDRNNADPAELKLVIAELLCAQGKPAEAQHYYRGAAVALRATRSPAAVASILHVQALAAQGHAFFPQAEQVYREALASYREAYGETNADMARCLYDLSQVLFAQTNYAEAETRVRESLAMRQKLFGDEHKDVNISALGLSRVLQGQGKTAEAERVAREAAQKCRAAMAKYELLASDRTRHQECWSFAISYEALGETLKEIGLTQEAEKAYRDAQLLWQKLVAEFNTEDYRFHLAANHEALGGLLRQPGQAAESLESYRGAQAIWIKLVAEFNQEDRRVHLGWTDENIGSLLKEAERLDEASEAFQQAIEAWRKLVADFNKDDYRNHLFGTLAILAETLRSQGKATEAESIEREIADHGNPGVQNELAWRLATDPDRRNRDASNVVIYAEKAVTATSRTNAVYLDTLAAACAEAGQFTNAVRAQQEAIALLSDQNDKLDYGSRLKLYQNSSPYRDTGLLAEQAYARLREGKFAEAEGPARECLVQREKEIPDHWRTFNARSMLGGALLGQKKYADAGPLLVSGYEGMKQREADIPTNSRVHLKAALQRVVELYEGTDRPELAAEWKTKLQQFDNPKK